MKNVFLTAGLIVMTYTSVYAQEERTPMYLDDTQPIELRIQDALKRMTLEEKTRLSYAQGKFSSPGCPRLGIPELWMSDGPHGLRKEKASAGTNIMRPAETATCFPPESTVACSWDEELIGKIGSAIAEEAKALIIRDLENEARHDAQALINKIEQEAQLAAEIAHDLRGEIRGKVGEVFIGEVGDHHHGRALVNARLEGDPLAAFKLLHRAVRDGLSLMGVGLGAAVAGEVL